ncbi:MAG: hypothetical protein CM1200mP41_32250 [Gammaproteobacteria bacterium]|nr:MAG: hypothetical protein CM1200mP41_32250 [Gammaproteobacteria bacterium]
MPKRPGGLSGQPLFDVLTELVGTLHHHLQGEIPIIAAGGIFSGDDAWRKLAAGASLIQIYTGFIYRGPQLIRDIVKTIRRQQVVEILPTLPAPSDPSTVPHSIHRSLSDPKHSDPTPNPRG